MKVTFFAREIVVQMDFWSQNRKEKMAKRGKLFEMSQWHDFA